MNVFAKRALILTVLVLCLLGVAIFGASAAATGSTTANPETDVASIVVDGTTYYYASLNTAITDALSVGNGTVTVLKDVTMSSAMTLKSGSLTLVGAADGVSISSSVSAPFWIQGDYFNITFDNVDLANFNAKNIMKVGTDQTTSKGEYSVTLKSVDADFRAGGAFYYYNVAKFDFVAVDCTFSEIVAGTTTDGVVAAGGANKAGANSYINLTFANCTLTNVVHKNTTGAPATGNITLLEGDAYYFTDAEAAAAGAVARLGNAEGGLADVVYFDTLADAVAAANGTVTLLKDVTLAETLVINRADATFTIDFNGKTVSAPSGVVGVKLVAGTVTMKNGTLAAQTDAIFMGTKALDDDPTVVLTLAADMTVTSVTDCCVVVYSGTLNTAATLTTTAANYCAVQGSGNNNGTVINVTGGAITAVDVAIYHPQNGTLNISGGTITGSTAVYVKAGTVSITGGKLVATGAAAAYNPNNDGCNSTGDALVVENAGDGYSTVAPTVSVTAGEFTSANAKGVASYADTVVNPDATPVTGFVTGGTFDSADALGDDVCAEGFELTDDGNGGFGVAPEVSANPVYIGSTPYASLEAAIAAAQEGDVIKLVGNVAISATMTVNKSLTITAEEAGILIYRASGFTGDMFAITAGTLAINNVTVDIGNTADTIGRGFNMSGSASLTIGDTDNTIATKVIGGVAANKEMILVSAATTGSLTINSDATLEATAYLSAGNLIWVNGGMDTITMKGTVTVPSTLTGINTSGLVLCISAHTLNKVEIGGTINVAGSLSGGQVFYSKGTMNELLVSANITDNNNAGKGELFRLPGGTLDKFTFTGTIVSDCGLIVNNNAAVITTLTVAEGASITHTAIVTADSYTGGIFYLTNGGSKIVNMIIAGTLKTSETKLSFGKPTIHVADADGIANLTVTSTGKIINNTVHAADNAGAGLVGGKTNLIGGTGTAGSTVLTLEEGATLTAADGSSWNLGYKVVASFATDADAIKFGYTIRLGDTVGGKSGTVYFADLATAVAAIPAGGTANLYVIAQVSNAATPVINNKYITVIGPDSTVNDGNYDIIHTGSSYLFHLDHKGSITLKNLAIKTSHSVLGYGYATTVTEKGTMAFAMNNTNVYSTYAHFVYSHGNHGNKTYPVSKFDITIDANSTVKMEAAATGTCAPFWLNKAYFDRINLTINGKMSYKATGASLNAFYFIYINNPAVTTVIGDSARITIDIPKTTEATSSFIYNTGGASSSPMTVSWNAIVVDGTPTFKNMPFVGKNINPTFTGTAPVFASDAAASTFAYFRVGDTEGGALGTVYFASLSQALAAIPNNPSDPAQRKLTNLYVIADGYTVSVEQELLDGKSVHLTSAGSTTRTITFSANVPIWMKNGAWLRVTNINLIMQRRFLRFDANTTTADNKFEMGAGAVVRREPNSSADGNFIYAPSGAGKITFTMEEGSVLQSNNYASGTVKMNLMFNLPNKFDAGSTVTIAGTIANYVEFAAGNTLDWSMFRNTDPDVTLIVKPTAKFITTTNYTVVNSDKGAMITTPGAIIIEGGTFQSTGSAVPPVFHLQSSTTLTFKAAPTFNLGTVASGNYSPVFTAAPAAASVKITTDAAAVAIFGAIARVGEIPADGGMMGTTFFTSLAEAAAATKDGKVYVLATTNVTADTTFEGVANVTYINATSGALFTISGDADLTINNAIFETSSALININATTGTVTIGENTKVYLVGSPAANTYLINVTGALNGKLDVKGDLYLGKSASEFVTGNGEMGFINLAAASENGVIDISGDLYVYAKTAGARNGFIYIKAALKSLNVSGTVTASVNGGDQVKFIWANAAIANGINFSATVDYTLTAGTISQFIFSAVTTAPVTLDGANITFTSATVNGAYSSIVFSKSPVTIVDSTLKVTGAAGNGFPILHNYDLDNVTFTIEDSTFVNETTGKYAQLLASQAQASFTTVLVMKGEIALTFAETSAKSFDAKKASYIEVTDLEKLTVAGTVTDYEAFATAQGLPYAYAVTEGGMLRTFYYAEIPAGATHKVVVGESTYYFGDLATACSKLVELKVENTAVLDIAGNAIVTYKPATAVDTTFTVDNSFYVDDFKLAIELANDGSTIVVNKSFDTDLQELVIAGKSITITGKTADVAITTNNRTMPTKTFFFVGNGATLKLTNIKITVNGLGFAVGSTDATKPAKFILGAGATLYAGDGRNSMIGSGNVAAPSMVYGSIVIEQGATIERNAPADSQNWGGSGWIFCFYTPMTGSVDIAGTINNNITTTAYNNHIIHAYKDCVLTVNISGTINHKGAGTGADKSSYVILVDSGAAVAVNVADSATITTEWTGNTTGLTNVTYDVAVEINGVTYKTNGLANAIALAPAGTLEAPTKITLLKDLALAPVFTIDGKHILITNATGNSFKITRPAATGDYMFSLKSGSLAFENIEIQIDGRVVGLVNYDSAKESTLRIGNGAFIHASAANTWHNSMFGIGDGTNRVYADIIVEKGAKVGYDAFTTTRETQIVFAYSPLTGDITLNGEFYNKINCAVANQSNFLLQVNSAIEGTVTFGADSVVTFEIDSIGKNAVVSASALISGGIHFNGTVNVTYKSTTNALAQAVVHSTGESYVYVHGASITLTSSATTFNTESAIFYVAGSVEMDGGMLKYAGNVTPGPVIYCYDNGANHVNDHITITGNSRIISEGTVDMGLSADNSYNALFIVRQPKQKITITGTNVYLECMSSRPPITLNNGADSVTQLTIDGATLNFPNTNKASNTGCTLKNIQFLNASDAARFGFVLRVGEGQYFNSLAGAIAAAPAGSTIYLTGNATFAENGIIINKSITIASVAGQKYTMTFPQANSGWTGGAQPFKAAKGTTITFQDIEVHVTGGRFMGFETTTSESERITLNLRNAFVHGYSAGYNGNAMLSMGSGSDLIYVNIYIDADSKIGYDAPAEGTDYAGTRNFQVIMAYGNYAGTMNIYGEVYQDTWCTSTDFTGTWTVTGYENQSIFEIHKLSGTVNIYGKMYQKTVYPAEALTINQPRVAVIIDVKAADSTACVNIDWRTATLVTEYVNADAKSGLYSGAGMQGATEVLDAEGNVIYTRFVNLFRDTIKIALPNLQGEFKNYRNFRAFMTADHAAGYSGNIGGMSVSGDIVLTWTGDNPYTSTVECFKSQHTGYTTGRASGTMLMEISNGADVILENMIMYRNGRAFSFRTNGDPNNPANIVFGENFTLQNHPSYTASSNNVWISAGVNDDQKTEIYANITMLPGSKLIMDSKLWNDRDLTVIFSTSIFVGNITLDGEIVMSYTGCASENQRLIASYGKTSYKNCTIEIGGKLVYDMKFQTPSLGVKAIDATGNGTVVIKDGADIYFNVTGCNAAESAFMKTTSGATGQLGLAIEGGKFVADNGYGFWMYNTLGDATFNVYDGYLEGKQYPVFNLYNEATLNVYGGIIAYTGNEDGVSPFEFTRGTLNVEGGVFKTTSTVAPVFTNYADRATINLNSYMAISATTLLYNAGKGTPTAMAHSGYGKSVVNMMKAEIGARPVFTDNADLGFMAVISNEMYLKLLNRADLPEDINANALSFGMLFVETDKLPEDVIFTHTGLDLAGIVAEELLEGSDNFTVSDCTCGNGCGDKVLRGSIAIDAEHYATRYSVVFFAQYNMDGHTTYAYTAFDASENSRSLDQVVRAAYNDTKASANETYKYEVEGAAGTYSPYTTEQRATLADWFGDASTSAELKNLDIYLLAGGSNAAGFAPYSNGFVEDYKDQLSANILYSGLIQTTIQQTIAEVEFNVPSYKYVPGSSEVGFNRGYADNTMGTELGMALALSKEYTGDNYAAIMKFAALDSTITEWNEELVEEFIAMVENEVTLYRRQGYNVTVKGMFWQQGEADVADAAAYATNFAALVSTLRANELMADMIVNVSTLSMYDALTGANITANEAFIEMQMALAADKVIVTDATILPTANGIIADTMDVLLNGQVAATEIMTAAGMEPEFQPEIKPVVTIDVEVEGETVTLEYRSIIVAIANLPAGAEIKLVDDVILYSPLKVTNAKDTVINGNGKTITLKPDAGAGIVIANTAIEFKDIALVQTNTEADAYVIQANKGAEIKFTGNSSLEANGTVAYLQAANAKVTIAGNTTLTNAADATDALIVTNGSSVIVKENATLAAKGNSACVLVEKSAPYKTTVAIQSGTFTTEGATTFVNNALEGILIVANDVMAQGATVSNAGFGTNGAYNELMK